MASKQSCREMATVPPASIHQKLNVFFANMACDVFSEFREPNSAPDETRVKDGLLTPLQWMLCGGDPTVMFSSLEEHQSQSNFCGKVFRSGEPAYFCKDCQTDPTCCFCMECFEHSEHKNHNYRLFASGGGGCCDCGDPEAWTSFVHCDIHKPSEHEEPEADPVEALPSDLADRARPFFSALLWYCMNMLCWEDAHSLPHSLMQAHTAQCLTEPTFLAFLYNDEDHSYDEVIYTLTANLKKTHTDAVALATFVDRKGRAVSKCGTEEECMQSRELINKDLQSGKLLKVVVYHSAVAAHQTCAILCLSLLKELAEKLDAFRRLISEALVAVSSSTGCCVLDRVFLNDSRMWITARIGWHRLVMSSIFMDTKCKPQLAVNLTRNYSELLRNFVADSHNHDVCASNMTVQLFTVPSLSRMLVKNHGLLEKIVNTLTEMVSPCKSPDTGVLKLTSSTYKHSRISYVMFDLRYVLRNKPESLSDMRQPVLDAFTKFLNLLGMVQNADPVKRQRGAHVEREEPWENLFNFLIVLQHPIHLFIDWCTSDPVLLREAVRLTLRKHEEVAKREQLVYKRHEVSPALVGKNKMELYVFDIQKEAISLHQPLARVLAGLLAGASAHCLSLIELLQISATDVQTPLFLMEHSARVLVMAVQVLAGMWKRNGYSVFRQVITYQYSYPREMMYDKDIVMLQSMAAILDPSVCLYSLIHKFRLDTWIANPDSDPSIRRGEPSEDALRFFLSEAEEFVFLLITIFCERYVVGVGQGVKEADALRRELIHKLFITPLAHSQILKEFRMNENESEIDRLLKQVATLRKGGGMSKSVFILRPSFEQEYNPFFYHYSRTDHSMAEETRRKRIKASGGVVTPESASPTKLPPFCQPFQGIVRLTTSPVIHRMFCCLFKQAADPESKFWSDRLLHEVLYLCAVMLREEDSSLTGSLCNAAIGNYGANQFLDALSSLLTSRRAEEHKPLLTWIVQILKKHREKCTGRHSPPTSIAKHPLTVADGATSGESLVSRGGGEGEGAAVQDEATARKELAKKQQEKAMTQMQNMQRKFLEKNREHMLDLDAGDGEEQVDTGVLSVVRSPTLRAVGLNVLVDRPSDPKAVTCILCQAETKDFARQEKAFLQAVCVQRSCVLRRGDCSDVKENDFDYLAARADHPLGMFTSGCGHHMHAECWRRFVESKQQEHGRRFFFPLPGQSVRWTSGEFLCPLCQCFSNSVVPLLPSVCSSTASEQLLHSDVGFPEWREIVRLAVELADAENVLDASSDSLWEKLTQLFGNFRKPSSYQAKSDGEIADVMGIFTQCTYMRAYKTDPDESNERVCVAEWNNCAYTISGLESNSRHQGKFLLASLSSRQVDYLGSLVKIGCEPKLRPPIKKLGSHVRKLVNSFLLESPPFTENPTIVELDAFTVMVYLHFAVVSLLASLVSPSGCLDDSPILPALVGLTALQSVRTAAAARLLQFLLTSSPAMDTGDSSAGKSASGAGASGAGASGAGASGAGASGGGATGGETSEGAALQKLWVSFRHRAGLPCDSPPQATSLLSGARDYLDPFLQCSVLFFQSFTGIEFILPSDASAVFSEMCKFLNVPSSLHTLLLEEPATSSSLPSLHDLATLWCEHGRLRQLDGGTALPPVLQQPRRMVSLPLNYSELVNKASKFQCPNHVVDGDDGQAAMLCLLCGQMLCTNSYCCMHEVEEDDEGEEGHKPLRIGGFTHHTQTCSGGMGMALWILESYVVLLDATDLRNVKGSTLTPPYLDKYGEPDPGLSRGTPLHLNEESLQELHSVWFQHRIPERITQEMESNRGLMRISWSRM